MKTIVVLSDTHRNLAPLEKIRGVLSECDLILHLGDLASDAAGLLREWPEKTYVLAGNNDFFGGERELVLDVEDRRIFACHGHLYGVRTGTERLAAAANAVATSPFTATRMRRKRMKRGECSSQIPVA